MPQAHAMRPFVSNPCPSSLLAGLRGGFTVHAENLMDAVVGYAYSQLVLIVGFKDQGSLFQVSVPSGAAWVLERWH